MKTKFKVLSLSLVAVFSIGQGAWAAVSADEAAKLKSSLTPLGAEKAGNKDGSIPAWDGVPPQPVAKTSSGFPGDPFANEKPKFQINAKNAAQYADRLSDGVLALMKKYPTFQLNVYPTHRTAGAPAPCRAHQKRSRCPPSKAGADRVARWRPRAAR